MKKLLITAITICMTAGGCAIQKPEPEPLAPSLVPKSFFDRTIVYQVSCEAKGYMKKLEGLLAHMQETTEPLPDERVVTLYRDADINRDHNITGEEARTYYEDYVIRFEDTLGPVQIR